MDFEKIEKLIRLMQQHDLGELQVKEEGFEFSARRGGQAQPVLLPAPASAAGQPAPASGSGATPAVPDNLKEITSPIVGTFYRAPAPDQPPYKEVGERVNPDDVVCIVEAMKVMNEIRASVGGTIRKVLVENATAVEYGQPLFLVEVG